MNELLGTTPNWFVRLYAVPGVDRAEMSREPSDETGVRVVAALADKPAICERESIVGASWSE